MRYILLTLILFTFSCRSVKRSDTRTIQETYDTRTTEIDTLIAIKPVRTEFKGVEIKDSIYVSKDKKSKLKLRVKDNKLDIEVEITPDSVEVKAKVIETSTKKTDQHTKHIERKGVFEIYKIEIIIGLIILVLAISLFIYLGKKSSPLL